MVLILSTLYSIGNLLFLKNSLSFLSSIFKKSDVEIDLKSSFVKSSFSALFDPSLLS